MVTISKSIDEVRGVYKNLDETKNNIGLYPFESLKEIHKIISDLGFGALDTDKSTEARKHIRHNCGNLRRSFLSEFDRSEPTVFDSHYLNNNKNPKRYMETSTKPTLYGLMEKVLDDSSLSKDEKIALIDELRKNNPAASDRWSPRVAIWILGIAIITTIICLTIQEKETNEGLIAIGSAAVGGLAGLISQVSRTSSDS